jgi:hypothetical protein
MLQKIIIIIAIGLLTLFAAEICVRALAALQPLETDPVFGLRPNIDGNDSDSRGFRNQYALATATIVTLGDSMTLGGNATREESWPAVLSGFASLPVYNMAMSGYGPVQFTAQFDPVLTRSYPDVLSMHPKLVIVGLYPNAIDGSYDMVYEREYWKNLRNPEHVGIDSDNISNETVDPESISARRITGYISGHSMAFARFADVTRGLRQLLNLAKTDQDHDEDLSGLAIKYPSPVFLVSESEIETMLTPHQHAQLIDLSIKRSKEGWRIIEDRIRQIAKMTNDAGVRLIIFEIPTKEQVYIEHLGSSAGGVPEELAKYKLVSDGYRTSLEKLCSGADLECISALPALVDALKNKQRTWSNSKESHPTAAGYRIIAGVVMEYLQENR